MQLREEIKRVQSQLKTAIQNHQMIVFKLKDRPVSTELRVQMNNVQRHIVSLGERQKKLLQELRKSLEVNGGNIKQERHVFASYLSQKPSPLSSALAMRAMQITIKKEPTKKESFECDIKSSGSKTIKAVETPSKVPQPQRRRGKQGSSNTNHSTLKNGHITPAPSPSRKESTPSSTPSSSPTHGHGSSRISKQRSSKQENSCPQSSASDESQDAFGNFPLDPEIRTKVQFMTGLGLITRDVLAELQSRRTERKRRSTANPQFLYGSSIDQAMKRKKNNYLINSNPALDNSPENLLDESIKVSVNVVCTLCTSGKGNLLKCENCHKSFHTHCGFESLPKQGIKSKCKTCLKEQGLKMEIDSEKESFIPVTICESVQDGV